MQERILVIDDDEMVNSAICQLLTHHGYDVVSATNGNEGLDTFNKMKVDLVITDIVMPEKEGIETILELKQIDNSIPIISISGGGRLQGQYLDLSKVVGVQKAISKPFKQAVLLEAVQELLKRA